MRFEFVESVLETLLDEGTIARTDSLLAVCAGDEEKELFAKLGFSDATISNLDARLTARGMAPFKVCPQDAQNLSFGDGQFDFSFVSDGLHHCSSPHRALLEMYRVARKGIIVFEARDSLLMRFANFLRLVPEYELEAVIAHQCLFGGVNNTQIPNYIFRWTERELKKTIRAYDPAFRHMPRFFYGLSLPYERSSMHISKLKLTVVRIVAPVVRVLGRVFKKQNNLLAMVLVKSQTGADIWPWLESGDHGVAFNQRYARKLFKFS
jgi:SAM-dependent methyltransferase